MFRSTLVLAVAALATGCGLFSDPDDIVNIITTGETGLECAVDPEPPGIMSLDVSCPSVDQALFQVMARADVVDGVEPEIHVFMQATSSNGNFDDVEQFYLDDLDSLTWCSFATDKRFAITQETDGTFRFTCDPSGYFPRADNLKQVTYLIRLYEGVGDLVDCVVTGHDTAALLEGKTWFDPPILAEEVTPENCRVL